MAKNSEKADAAYAEALKRIEACGNERKNFLDLSELGLTTLPPVFGQLTELTTFYLQGNQLTALPVWLRDLPKLERLYLHDNSALQLSPSVLGPDSRNNEGRSFVSAKSILDFYFGRQTQQTRPLNEVKLILVGRGGAGKTCTVRALRDLPFQGDEESTPGIALCDWTMDGCKGESVTAHVWDFAGQVITHALHQFFFSVRSVYVVVLTGR